MKCEYCGSTIIIYSDTYWECKCSIIGNFKTIFKNGSKGS